jgi:hypothetical protein
LTIDERDTIESARVQAEHLISATDLRG